MGGGGGRKTNIELLRILAMFLIMMYHYVIHGGIELTTEWVSINSFTAKMMCMGGKIGVNIFIIITSWFLCDKEIDNKKLVSIYIKVWIYSVILFMGYTLLKEFNFTNFIRAIFPVSFSSNWYATAYIIFCLVLPYFQNSLKVLSKRNHFQLSMLLVTLFCIIPSLTGDFFISALNPASNLVWFFTMYIVTCYLKRYILNLFRFTKLQCILGIIGCYIFFAFSIILLDVYKVRLCILPVFNSTYLAPINSISVVICSFLLFILFCNLKVKQNKFINLLAKTTFGVYLLHDNYLIRSFLWKNVCKSSRCFYDENIFILLAISGIVMVFAICSLVDFIYDFLKSHCFMHQV